MAQSVPDPNDPVACVTWSTWRGRSRNRLSKQKDAPRRSRDLAVPKLITGSKAFKSLLRGEYQCFRNAADRGSLGASWTLWGTLGARFRLSGGRYVFMHLAPSLLPSAAPAVTRISAESNHHRLWFALPTLRE